MYRIGRGEELQQDGLMPQGSSFSDLENMVDAASSQTASKSLPTQPRCSQGRDFDVVTTVLGVRLHFLGGSSEENVLLCEGHLTAIESFLATAFTNGIWPKTEDLLVQIERQSNINEIKMNFDSSVMVLTVSWPTDWSILDVGVVSRSGSHLVEFCAQVLDAIAMVPDAKNTFEEMFTQERLFERTTSFSFAHFAQSRILGKYISALSDLGHLVQKTYEIKGPIPTVKSFEFPEKQEEKAEPMVAPTSHDGYTFHSVINTHLWDKAGWAGLVYAHGGPLDTSPPSLA